MYKLNPPAIEYDCWCFDICHESEDAKIKHEHEQHKDAVRDIWGEHYDIRTALYGVVMALGFAGNIAKSTYKKKCENLILV